MGKTDKDTPWHVMFPDGWPGMNKARAARIGGDSGFRKARRLMKRARSKANRRYIPEAKDNGAKEPYCGQKRTWDFE